MDDIWTMKKELPDFMGTNPVGWISVAEEFFTKNKIHPCDKLQWAFMSMEDEVSNVVVYILEPMLWFI
ncbi:hypothetical protein A2U01_0055247 [Trifolium medium]|uniref:Uncharacterized protein n=1 Tax=Trifolium medium TaxID=97028 RepID=A0A392RCP8_9FABA|nr:hypothetical protein [Trifolium medium]